MCSITPSLFNLWSLLLLTPNSLDTSSRVVRLGIAIPRSFDRSTSFFLCPCLDFLLETSTGNPRCRHPFPSDHMCCSVRMCTEYCADTSPVSWPFNSPPLDFASRASKTVFRMSSGTSFPFHAFPCISAFTCSGTPFPCNSTFTCSSSTLPYIIPAFSCSGSPLPCIISAFSSSSSSGCAFKSK
jgi:hypothetical protein